MSFYKIKEVAEIALNKAVDETEEVVEAARKFYCNLHQNHPAWTVARNFSNSSLILRAIDRMCDDGTYTPPPAPVPPFTGGQCCSIRYDVRCFVNIVERDGDDGGRLGELQAFGRGKVIGGRVVDLNNGTGVRSAEVVFEACDGTFIYRPVYQTVNMSLASTIDIAAVFPTEGATDNCGDPPADYPPEAPPTDNDLTQTVTITNIENNSYDYDVTVNRDTNNTINFPPSITVNNIAVNLDVTGITVGDTTNINIESGGNDSGVFPPLPVPVEDENAGKELVTEPGAVEENVADLYAVLVNFTAIPFNAKISSGADAPRIIYGGWVEFKIGSDYLPREYIDFDNSVFLAPEGATGYAVTIKLGYNATITKQFYRETTDAS